MNRICKVLFTLLLTFAMLFALSCGKPKRLSYEEYSALSGEEQREYFETFQSVEDFFAWYEKAKDEYIASHPDAELGDLEIDLGEADDE